MCNDYAAIKNITPLQKDPKQRISRCSIIYFMIVVLYFQMLYKQILMLYNMLYNMVRGTTGEPWPERRACWSRRLLMRLLQTSLTLLSGKIFARHSGLLVQSICKCWQCFFDACNLGFRNARLVNFFCHYPKLLTPLSSPPPSYCLVDVTSQPIVEVLKTLLLFSSWKLRTALAIWHFRVRVVLQSCQIGWTIFLRFQWPTLLNW